MLSDTDFIYLKQFQQSLATKYHKSLDQVLQDPVCIQEYRLEIRKVQSRIPAKYRAFTMGHIKHPALELSKEYIEDYLENLATNKMAGVAPLLWGSSGTGKTMLGCIVLMEALKRNYSTYFTKVGECIDLLTSSWYDEEVKQEFHAQVLSTDFLMIDDMGDEFKNLASNSNLRESTLNRILRVRTDNLRPTILTTNLDPTKIKEGYDFRIFSIIKEHAIIIPCNGYDWREHVKAHKINPK